MPGASGRALNTDLFQRRRSESNRRIQDLQSRALPLGYGAALCLQDGRAAATGQAALPIGLCQAKAVRRDVMRDESRSRYRARSSGMRLSRHAASTNPSTVTTTAHVTDALPPGAALYNSALRSDSGKNSCVIPSVT